ncbi:MAG: hypothetical protein NXI20_13265 [bacterium]|nr:hypothetical protein [bacterium]
MKLILPLFTMVGLIALTAISPFNTRTFKEFEYKGKSLRYGIQLPNDFDPDKTYPVIIGPSELQGKGDQCYYWRGVADTNGWILIDYSIYNGPRKKEEIKALMEYLKKEYNVENNKFHAVCFSANSAMIFDLVMAIPEYFEGITGMAGNPRTTDVEQLKSLKGVNVQFVVGDRDNYWMKAAQKRHGLLLQAGVKSSLEIIKNGEHVLTNLIGEGFLERADRLRETNIE